MKNFPRLYSLSTLGIIHHQEFDYLFHPFRTDFIGESGVGKSMMADLIQLIFVGSDAFKSATEGNNRREPDGMVLTDKGRGGGIGYAFLNIQKSPNEWLVVGTYLESGVRHAQAFIIQKGFDWSRPVYLSAPLGYQQLLKGDQILPLEELKNWVYNQGMHCESWQRYRKFHEILFNQNILPLDVTQSDRVLRDYAAILQSFSRGKGLDTRSSDSLCQFLFGKEAANKIWTKYLEAVKDMENSIGEYGQNLNEIQRVTAKQKALVELRGLKAIRDAAQHSWLLQELRFWHQEVNRFQSERTECVLTYLKAKQYKSILDDILTEEVLAMKERVKDFRERQDELNEAYENQLPDYKAFEKAHSFRQSFQGSDASFRQAFEGYHEKRGLRAVLDELESKLKKAGVTSEFAALPTTDSLFDLQGHISATMNALQSKLDTKKVLTNYVRLTDPNSLSYWAFQQNRTFNLEEESVILAFQHLPRKKANDVTEYLPEPAELINALSIVEKEKDGFWISLNGIRRLIPYTTTPIFQTTDKTKIQSYFNAYTNRLEKEVAELTEQISRYNSILRILSEIKDSALVVEAYNRREELQKHKDIPAWNISLEVFEEMVRLSSEGCELNQSFQTIREAREANNEKLIAANALLKNLNHYSARYLNKPMPVEEELILPSDHTNAIMDADSERRNIEHRLGSIQDQDTFLANELETTEKRIQTIYQLPKLNSSIEENRSKLLAAQKRYLQFYETPPGNLTSEKHITGFSVEYDSYLKAESKYFAEFGALVQQYISTEAYCFESAKDFIELATHLLPEAFRDTVLQPSESAIIDTIEAYLVRINEKNRQLNSRKIQKSKLFWMK